MPFDDEFRRHLHDLMIETSLGLRDELNQHKREVVWKARQTHNAAALPNAYSAAAIHAFRTRVETTVSRYIEALGNCGVEVDENVEKEMLSVIGALTRARQPVSFPPAIEGPQVAAVQRAHAMELERVAQFLYRKAANQLREAKMRARKKLPKSHRSSPMLRSEPFTIASVAKTLGEVKALPAADQDMLLLRKLAHIYPQMGGTGGLHKGNLLLPADGYGLGMGLSPAENMPIRQYLLGAPWTRLVNAGFLVDPSGSGFFSVSDEGLAAITSAEARKTSMALAIRNPDIPTAFMSYSWDSEEHKEWVLRLAERLRAQGGVDVILDRWNLPVGADRTHFMEQSIRDSDFVLLACTPSYATKSNNRAGGVGYEAMILTSQLVQKITQKKFIPILRVGEWNDSAIPIWLQSKIGVDLRSEPYSEEQYQLLLRTLHQAEEKAPPIGPKPKFPARTYLQGEGLLDNAVTAVLGTARGATAVPTQTGVVTRNQPKQSPVAYAFYEKQGSGERVQVFVRPFGSSGDLYSLDTSTGSYEEGDESQITLRYLSFDLNMKRDGYVRRQSFNGSSGQRFNLP